MDTQDFDFAKFSLMFISEIEQTHNGAVRIYRVEKEGQEYALKVVQKASLDTVQKQKHILNEKAIMKQLDHPMIPKLIDTFHDDNYLCILQELVYGVPLHKIIESERSIKLDFLDFIGYQLALVLEYIHSQGIVYRDIKASNVMMTEDGRVYLIDFGMAKKIDKHSSICGTTHGMAPEMFADHVSYGYEIDYYSFGILMYELAHGREPPFGYDLESNPDLKKNIIKGLGHDQLAHIKNEKFKDLIEKLLQHDPKKRLGHNGGFKEISEHSFFKFYKRDEVVLYQQGMDPSATHFKSVLGIGELYLEDAYLMGVKKKSNYQPKGDPFEGF